MKTNVRRTVWRTTCLEGGDYSATPR